MDFISTFQSGGFSMYILLICFIMVLVIAGERYKYYKSVKVNNEDFIEQLKIILKQKNWKYAMELCKSDESLISAVAETGIESLINKKANISAAIEARSAVVIANLKRNLNFLDTMVMIAPIIGLLGTVLNIMASLNEKVEQTSGIGVIVAGALSSTAFGLFIAASSIVILSYFNYRLEKMTNEIGEISNMLNSRTLKNDEK